MLLVSTNRAIPTASEREASDKCMASRFFYYGIVQLCNLSPLQKPQELFLKMKENILNISNVDNVIRVMKKAPEKVNGDDGLPIPPYKVYNIGNNNPENLLDFVNILQEELIRAGVLPKDYDFEAHKELVAMQPGDVPITYADTTPLENDFGFKPSTSLRDGLRKFAEWYKEFYMN